MRSRKIFLKLVYFVTCLLCIYIMIVPKRLNWVRSITKDIINQATEHSPSLAKIKNQVSVTKRSALLQEMTVNKTSSRDRMQSHSNALHGINETKIADTDTPAILERERLYLKFLDTAHTIDELLKDKPKTKRFPDVINIGAEKCGTGFLREIFLRHPTFLFPKRHELQFFTFEWNAGTEHYRNEMPESSPYHVVMEKTPSYFNYARTAPQRMHSLVPKAKIIVLLCDPVNRTFSDFVHEVVMGPLPNDAEFDSFMPHIIDRNKEILSHLSNDKDAIDFIFKRLPGIGPYHLMSTALYYYHMIRWLEWFPREQIYVIDGEELIRDPGKVVEELQEYLGVPKLIIKEDFERGENGFYCIHTPNVEERMGIRRVVKGDLDCMDKSRKGRTRFGGTAYKPSEKILSELRDFFRPFNDKLYRLLGRRFPWD